MEGTRSVFVLWLFFFGVLMGLIFLTNPGGIDLTAEQDERGSYRRSYSPTPGILDTTPVPRILRSDCFYHWVGNSYG